MLRFIPWFGRSSWGCRRLGFVLFGSSLFGNLEMLLLVRWRSKKQGLRLLGIGLEILSKV